MSELQKTDELRKEIARRGLSRLVHLEREQINSETRTVTLAFASDKPVEHWFGYLSLTMSNKAMRAERLSNGAPLLLNHDMNLQIGVVENYLIGPDGMARATVRFSRSALADEIFRDVLDGIRRNVSVGFLIHEIHLEKEDKEGPSYYRSDDWEPFEISIVSVPADISVGVGRSGVSAAAENQAIQLQETTMSQELQPQTTPAASPPVDIQTARTTRTRELIEWAQIFGTDAVEIARDLLLHNPEATQDDIRKAVLIKRQAATFSPQNESLPTQTPHIQFEDAGHTEVRGKKVVDDCGWGLTAKQMASISTNAYRDAFLKYLRNSGIERLGMSEVRVLQEGVDSAGGFLVPAEFIAQMIERRPPETTIQNYVTRFNTSSDRVIMPRNNYSASDLYTTGVRVNWVDEIPSYSPSTGAENLGSIQISVQTAMMEYPVTRNLLEDASFDIMGWLQNKFAETIDSAIEESIISGSGIGRPAGILLNPGGTNQPGIVVSGNASSVTADGLIDLAWSLRSRYRRNARFVFNSPSTGKAIAKLKDAQNRYLFAAGVTSDGLATARPSTLLGFPIIESDFMPDIAANAFPIIFGDLAGYYLVQRVGFSIEVLKEVKASQNQVSVLGRLRIGGQVAEDWRLKIQKIST